MQRFSSSIWSVFIDLNTQCYFCCFFYADVSERERCVKWYSRGVENATEYSPLQERRAVASLIDSKTQGCCARRSVFLFILRFRSPFLDISASQPILTHLVFCGFFHLLCFPLPSRLRWIPLFLISVLFGPHFLASVNYFKYYRTTAWMVMTYMALHLRVTCPATSLDASSYSTLE